MFGRLPQLLKEKKPAFGSWITIGNPEITEMISLIGFDWLLIDLEHAPIDYQLLEYMLIGVKNGTTPLVRVPFNDPVYVKRVLDVGAAGVLFPLISNKEDAKFAVKSTRYPPEGIRGVGPRRAASYGLRKKEYFEKADEVIVVVQIETRDAVKNIEDILSTDGVSAFFIGPNDLSFSYGCRTWKADEVRSAIIRVAEVSQDLGVPGGMYCWGEESVKFALDLGFVLIALGSDYRFLVYGATTILDRAKKLKEDYNSR